MSYCGSCGTQSAGRERFCLACGAALSSAQPEEEHPSGQPGSAIPGQPWGDPSAPPSPAPGSSSAGSSWAQSTAAFSPPDRYGPMLPSDQQPSSSLALSPRRSRRRLAIAGAIAAAVIALGAAVGVTYVLASNGGKPAKVGSTATTVAPAANLSAAPGSTTPTAPSTTATTQPAQTFASLYQTDVGGVIRIDASTCSGSGVGSGFLVSPTLVATAAHVVDGAAAIGLTAGNHTTSGHVIGVNDSVDVALIQTTVPISGHVFTFTRSVPPVGTAVGVIGYPEGGPVSFSQGSISGLDRSIDVEGRARTGLLQTDAAINPGNSGGPLLVLDGTVAGLADAKETQASGIGYAVPAQAAGPSLAPGRRHPRPLLLQPAAILSAPRVPVASKAVPTLPRLCLKR